MKRGDLVRDLDSLYSPSKWFRDVEKDFFNLAPFRTSGAKSNLFAFENVFTDVIEQKDKYLITADLPGMNKDNVKVSIKEGYLQIVAERNEEKEEKDEKEQRYHRQERYYGKVVRSIPLPEDVIHDYSRIKASYKNGVLSLELPKDFSQHEEEKPHEIEIKD